MSTTLELKYFNTFWLKKMKNVVENTPSTPVAPYSNVPKAFTGDNARDWYIEESRIRGGYNNTTVDFGVKAYIAEDHPEQQNRINTMIYSGIFNSRTGVNNTNQFSVAENITRSVDPANGSIQRLYAEDTNLIIFQEDKVSRALIDKDAIYSAEGTALTTSGAQIIGQIVPYAGEYGISQDPFSFAVYGFRKYFTDRKRNAVLRLASNGSIVEISGFGMHDFFRDKLSAVGSDGLSIVDSVRGGFDYHTKNYVLSIQNTAASGGDYVTSSFDEDVKGWTSFFDYKPTFVTSLNSSFYSFFDGKIWKHHNGSYGNFYGTTYNSDVTLLLNSQPSTVKVFQTINYEGATGWELQSMVGSSGDLSLPISPFIPPSDGKNAQGNPDGTVVALDTLESLEQNIWANNFKRKENKFFANLINNSGATAGEVLWGAQASGLKGFWSTVKMKLNNTTYNVKKELFAVSSDTVESSY
mgnify:CR=1 FL=1